MINRLYIHNIGCFENFEFNAAGYNSVLFVGKNGSGKSTLLKVLQIFQKIGRGTHRLSELVALTDVSYHRFDSPIRLEIEVVIGEKRYSYNLAVEKPESWTEYRVLEESLSISGQVIYDRKLGEVTLVERDAKFLVDWHLVALPIIQSSSFSDVVQTWKDWLSNMVLLEPIPQLMLGESKQEALTLNCSGSNLSDWIRGILANHPASYSTFERYLKQVIPDLSVFMYEVTGKTSKNLIVKFKGDASSKLELSFEDLSSGEKIFFLGAAVLAAQQCYPSLFCFWDEPDNYLSLSEVGHFIVALRKCFQNQEWGSQIWITSHNPEAIERFSQENTWVLDRKSHLEPTLISRADALNLPGDFVMSLRSGEIQL